MKIKLKDKYKKTKNIWMKNPKFLSLLIIRVKNSISLKMKKRKRKTLLLFI